MSDDIVYYSAEHGIVTPTPGGRYEPASHSAAKNIVLVELEDLDPDYEAATDHIEIADRLVEALLKAGVTIPEDIKDPCKP